MAHDKEQHRRQYRQARDRALSGAQDGGPVGRVTPEELLALDDALRDVLSL